jgi:hypothetical protein
MGRTSTLPTASRSNATKEAGWAGVGDGPWRQGSYLDPPCMPCCPGNCSIAGELEPDGAEQIRRQPAHLTSVALGKGLALPRAAFGQLAGPVAGTRSALASRPRGELVGSGDKLPMATVSLSCASASPLMQIPPHAAEIGD